MHRRISSYQPYLLLGVFSALVISVFSKSSPLYPLNDWVDANCFLTTGKSILSGHVLYRDVYEQKGPLLYFLHALAALVSDRSFLGVWLLEILCCFSFALSLWRYAGRPRDARLLLLPGLLTLIFSTTAFASGDSAEELSLPLLAYSLSVALTTPVPDNRHAYRIGMAAGAILWIKYTLCGFYLAYALYIAVFCVIHREFSRLFRLILFFLLGMLTVSVPVLLYFLVNGAVGDLYEVYFLNNITRYSPSAGGARGASRSGLLSTILTFAAQNPVITALIVLGVLYTALRDLRHLPVLLLGLTACLVFVSLGTRPYPYYAFILAAFTLPGYRALTDLAGTLRAPALARTVLSLLLSLLCFSWGWTTSLNTYLLGTDRQAMPQYQFAAIISQNEDATLLNYGFLDGGFYTAAGITPSSRFFCQLNISLPEMTQEMNRSLQEGSTDYVVTRGRRLDSDRYTLVAQSSFPYQSNADRPRSFTYYLYRRTSEDASTSLSMGAH